MGCTPMKQSQRSDWGPMRFVREDILENMHVDGLIKDSWAFFFSSKKGCFLGNGRTWDASNGQLPHAENFVPETGPRAGPRPGGQASGAQASHILFQFSSDFRERLLLLQIFIC